MTCASTVFIPFQRRTSSKFGDTKDRSPPLDRSLVLCPVLGGSAYSLVVHSHLRHCHKCPDTITRLRRPHDSSPFFGPACLCYLVDLHRRVSSRHACAQVFSSKVARDPDPHVMREDCPSRQPVAKVFVSVIVQFAFISRMSLHDTLLSLYACFPC